jgi:2-phospho-L-lactate guanylyltransferase (CobY/MobA/RfbA family)
MIMEDCHPHRVTSTKCRIGTVFSPDDGHKVVRNMQRRAMNILRTILHQVGSIYKITQGSAVNKILKKNMDRQVWKGYMQEVKA